MKQFADAANEYGEVITSSPAPMPAEMQSRCKPDVPDETAAAYGAPTFAANASSKRSIIGPRESRLERRTSSTSSSSRASTYGPDSGTGITSCCKTGSVLRLGLGCRRVLEPVRPAVATTVHGVEVRLLDLHRHRAGTADHVIVDLADRRHLRGRTDHEHLVGEVEVGADQGLLDNAVPEVLRDLDHGVARDADENRRRQVGRVDHAVLDDEDALPGTVGDEAFGGQQDRLVVSGAVRLADGEHRVDVDPGRLRRVRDDVRADALPARHLDANAVAHAFLAEIRAPRPRHDRDVDRVVPRCDAELAVAAVGDRTQVAVS